MIAYSTHMEDMPVSWPDLLHTPASRQCTAEEVVAVAGVETALLFAAALRAAAAKQMGKQGQTYTTYDRPGEGEK